MELFIKNMVCERCITTVKHLFNTLSIGYTSIELGEVKLREPITDEKFISLKDQLHLLGFELLDDRKAAIVTQIKSIIIKYIHSDDASEKNKKLSVLLSEKLNTDYNYLSALFSSIAG